MILWNLFSKTGRRLVLSSVARFPAERRWNLVRLRNPATLVQGSMYPSHGSGSPAWNEPPHGDSLLHKGR